MDDNNINEISRINLDFPNPPPKYPIEYVVKSFNNERKKSLYLIQEYLFMIIGLSIIFWITYWYFFQEFLFTSIIIELIICFSFSYLISAEVKRVKNIDNLLLKISSRRYNL